MWKQSSKRFQGVIVGNRANKNNYHLNTITYPSNLQMSRKPYENAKRKLQHSGYRQSGYKSRKSLQKSVLSQREMEEVIKNSVNNEQEIPQQYRNMIKNVSCVPVVSKTSENTFNQQEYPLLQEQKVKVCRHFIFNTKNYFNYLYEMQNQQAAQVIRDKFEKYLKPTINQQLHLQNQSLKNNAQQALKPEENQVPRFENTVVQSKHTNFKDKNKKTFWVKQIDRKRMAGNQGYQKNISGYKVASSKNNSIYYGGNSYNYNIGSSSIKNKSNDGYSIYNKNYDNKNSKVYKQQEQGYGYGYEQEYNYNAGHNQKGMHSKQLFKQFADNM